METEIKVRKPKPIKYFGFAKQVNAYTNRQYKWMSSYPKEGSKIIITWFPNNNGEKNAYIGMSGIVEDLDIINAVFVLKCEGCSLICHGDFNYINLPLNSTK